MRVSSFASAIQPSATMAAGAKAKELKSQGIEVFDFAMGEPDFDTPEHICQAAFDAMKKGETHYTPAAGTLALRRAIADYHKKWHQISYEPDQVCVSNGAKHALYNALLATINPGDEVIIPAPYWVSYSEMVKMVGGEPIILSTTPQDRFTLSPERLRAACTPRSRMLMLNSPSNPTGSCYTPQQLAELAKIAVEKDLIVLSDEIYERLLYGDAQFQAFAALGDDVYRRTLTINGVSKSYAMTGWRIGWTAGPKEVIKAIGDIQSQQTSNPSSVSQAAAIAALTGDQHCVEAMKQQFAKRRDYVVDRLGKIPGIGLTPPDGAFYAFFDVSGHFGRTLGGAKIANSDGFCMAALAQAHVNVVSGAAFGAEGFARMSFAASMETLEKGLDALENWLK